MSPDNWVEILLRVAGASLVVAVVAGAYWWGLRERRRRLRRAVLKGPTGVQRVAFQSAEDGAMELLIRRKDLKAMLKGESLEGLLKGAGGASMLFRVRSQL